MENKQTRTKLSIRNAIIATITNILTILIGFVAQAVFVRTLGKEYLGINGLFSNIISMLGIVELGIGTTIIFHLYKPIAENNTKRIQLLMNFYKKSYRIIALVITVIGLMIVPFINIIVGENNIQESIYLIYGLFLLDIVCSYLLTYKRSILYANQQTYIVNIIHIGYLIFMNILQIIFLIINRNYILYLIIKILFRILENVIITIVANKKYPFVSKNTKEKLDKCTFNDIIKKVKAMVFHKVGDFVVSGTNNIIISMFLGISTVGMYSNYSIIINALNNLLSQVYSSIFASVGNLLTEKNSKKSYNVFKKMFFINNYIAIEAATFFICLVTPFIEIWVGKEYILSTFVIISMTVDFYIFMLRNTMNTYKTAAGIFYEDRYIPIIVAIVNIVFSVLLVKIIGLSGVFIGTILSTLVYHFIDYPKYAYEVVFKRSGKEYIKKITKSIIIFMIIMLSCFGLVNVIQIENVLIKLVASLLITLIYTNIVIYIIYKNQFKEFIFMIVNIIKAKIKS